MRNYLQYKNNMLKTHAIKTSLLVCAMLISNASLAEVVTAKKTNSANSPMLGLYPANQFQLINDFKVGDCANCATTPQALWYFKHQTIAVPYTANNAFNPKLSAQADVKEWRKNSTGQTASMPTLIWLGSPDVTQGKLSADGKLLETAQTKLSLSLTPKIATNQSYYNENSTQYFAGRNLVLRGKASASQFTARSIWPQDYNLDLSQIPYQPLKARESLASLIRNQNGGATAPFSARVLYKSSDITSLQNKPVLSFVLNGAQGDDDEAHGGHFAIATGRFGAKGEWQDWLVNNFYNLGSVSEKGIIAATLPMDSYQGDLNSGQSWYRPSYMLVAVLKNERSAATYQSAINRVMQHFYRQDFLYHHASANCAGINLDTLRTLEWSIPKRGATNLPKAFIALPYKAISEMNLEEGLRAYDYLSTEQTKLYPFVAFEAVGNDLLERIAKNQAKTPFEKQLAEDLEAIIYVHLPQFPSSRAMGQAPVASIDEYIARTPADITDWKIIPVGARHFPDALKDKNAPSEPLRAAYYGLMAWLIFVLAAVFGIVKLLKNKGRR